MPKSAPEPRPAKRKARLDVPVDQETLNKARIRAGGKMSRLRAAVRAFLDLWGDNELNLPEEEIDRQEQRAAKRSRKNTGPE